MVNNVHGAVNKLVRNVTINHPNTFNAIVPKFKTKLDYTGASGTTTRVRFIVQITSAGAVAGKKIRMLIANPSLVVNPT